MSRTISIVVTCYNFRTYIAETLASLADQTVGDFEAIVVDNNSTDGSDAIIERIADGDSRFVLVREPRQGVHHAMNAGLARATGDLVLLLDGDDRYQPDRLARTLEHFEATGADLVACNGQRIDATGRREELFESYFHSTGLTPAVMCQYNPIWTVSFLALTRDALDRVGPLPETYSRILDWHLPMRAFERDLRVSFLDAPLVLKRYHGQNLAFDVEVTERQAIPRLREFMDTYAPLQTWYGPADRSRLLTVRYVRAFEQMRRQGRWATLVDYLADEVGPTGIREDVHRFVRAIAAYHLDRAQFDVEVRAWRSDHPLWLFVQGIAELERGCAESAARYFEWAFVRSLRRFREAMNSWAVAVAQFDAPRAVTMLDQLVQWSPDYRDARLNLAHLRLGEAPHCRHTVCLRPDTLHWLADWA